MRNSTALTICSSDWCKAMLDIAFIFPGPGISGGVNVILRHAMELLDKGASITMVSEGRVEPKQLAWHPIGDMLTHPNLVWCNFSEVAGRKFDVAIATWWMTYFDLARVDARKYAYFVQSIESRFYSLEQSEWRAAVDATYELPVAFITEAKWIADYLRLMHSHSAYLVPNGIDRTIFRAAGAVISPRTPGRLRVLVEGPLEAPFKKVSDAIRLARDGGAHEIWLLTSSNVADVEGVDRIFSQVPQEKTPEVYRSCDVLVKLSTVEGMFGPPLEMFCCGGTTIVYDVTGHDEYIAHGVNGLVAPMNDENRVQSLVKSLVQVPELLAKLKEGALRTASQWPAWRESGDLFYESLLSIRDKPNVERKALQTYSRTIWGFLRLHQQQRQTSDDQRRELSDNLASAHLKIRDLEHKSEELSNGYSEVSEAYGASTQLISSIYESTSWKLTRPIRLVGRLISDPSHVRKAIASRFSKS